MNTPSIHLADLTAPIIATAAIAFALGIVAPATSFAQDSKEKARQNDKNLMRNLGIGLGAAAVYEGLKGKTTNAAVLGAGAALAGKKYEDARKAQSKDNRFGYGTPRYDDRFDNNDRFGNDGRYGSDNRPGYDDRYDDRRDNDGRFGSDRYNNNNRYDNSRYDNRYDNRRDPRGVSYKAPKGRHDNGNHNGWYKKQSKGGCD